MLYINTRKKKQMQFLKLKNMITTLTLGIYVAGNLIKQIQANQININSKKCDVKNNAYKKIMMMVVKQQKDKSDIQERTMNYKDINFNGNS